MSLLAIEFDDAGVRATRAPAGELLVVDLDGSRASPGVARVEGGTITTGDAAARQTCLHPRTVHDRFWDRLDTEPLDPRNPDSPNRAEIACVHLQHILARVRQPDDEIVLVVPPTYDDRQLGILVGIARELELPLTALVASPVAIEPGALEPGALDSGALEAGEPAEGRRLVVDVGLHRGVVSTVEKGAARALGDVKPCPDVSLRALRRQWVKAIGAEFVRKTRFDPLHDAATEQEVHDRLPALLDAIAEKGSEQLEIETGGRGHRVTVSGQLLAHAGHALVVELGRDVQGAVAAAGDADDGAPSAILLTANAARIPGLIELVRRQGSTPVHELAPGAAALGLARLWPEHFDQSVTGGVTYHTRRASAAAAG